MLENSALEAKIINHPISRYKPIDQTFIPLPDVASFKIVPVSAKPHIIPKIVHPIVPRKFTNKNGVYVPAIK